MAKLLDLKKNFVKQVPSRSSLDIAFTRIGQKDGQSEDIIPLTSDHDRCLRGGSFEEKRLKIFSKIK